MKCCFGDALTAVEEVSELFLERRAGIVGFSILSNFSQACAEKSENQMGQQRGNLDFLVFFLDCHLAPFFSRNLLIKILWYPFTNLHTTNIVI